MCVNYQECVADEQSDEDGESFSEHIPSDSDRKLPSEDDCKLTKPNLESHPIPRTARVRPVGVQLALGANSERAVQTDGNRARLEGWKQIEIPEGILPASKGNSGPATEEYQTGRGDQEPKSHEGETVNSGKKRRKGKRRGKESKKKHQNKQKRRQAKAGHLGMCRSLISLPEFYADCKSKSMLLLQQRFKPMGYDNLRESNQQNVLDYMAETADMLFGQYPLSIPPCSFAIPCLHFGQVTEHVPQY
ncbi:hypothetical protein M231_02422 [Tremella mesenterica]|uniref:Uncharacterized protein n=1 Tax=Tremella mesenterica TaxID=5217 RepID=A0A4Q1BQU4_TREME|nr:hypothetical protein M231_02422 [Tremella mesenterica]